jgi:hypothetical protein
MTGTHLFASIVIQIIFLTIIVRYARRKEMKKMVVVDEIPAQPFAGKPVTPIPVMHYTDSKGAKVELALFTLTYEDNDRMGTAEVVIHGKGGYKGQKAVTFSIVAP